MAIDKPADDWVLLGKYDSGATAFVSEVLEAAEIEFRAVDDSVGAKYSVAQGRMVETASMYDLEVRAARLPDAKAVVERWQTEAAEAAIRESGAPPEETEGTQEAPENRNGMPWRGLVIMALGAILLVAYRWFALHK
jgi:hypothetical protein